ncbi:hypothetical protein [Sphingomonas sp.]|uniref:hypothetical protein n=1 Tax=Sphingomonas sp. TaxID=28214 RepID=UPI001EC2DFC0|nr:hypothetical protein [Sphingomonas sp.]MBX3593729.1 sigma-70 family RNA polymerase sigma factor [Sphingomonas sp.]
MIDDATRAALDRLTEAEKMCLRRRFVPQTAKEMAIDLGISPHAIDKRLKMARTRKALPQGFARTSRRDPCCTTKWARRRGSPGAMPMMTGGSIATSIWSSACRS